MTKSSRSHFAILAIAAFTLTGCAGTPSSNRPILNATLLRPLEIGPGEASARLQYGRVVPRNGVQDRDPYCIFEIDTVADRPQPVAPQTFRVASVQYRVETASGMPFIPLGGAGFWRDSGPSHVFFTTDFRLHTDNPIKARALTCQHNQAGVGVPRHLSDAEIRQALGDHFRFDLPGGLFTP